MNRKRNILLSIPFLICLLNVWACGARIGRGEGHDAARSPQTAIPRSFDLKNNKMVHFSPLPSPPPPPGAEGSIVNDQVAWVRDPTTGELLRTVDGGGSWEKLKLAPQYEPIFGRISDMSLRFVFATPSRGWIAANSGTWVTEDGGATWTNFSPDLFDALAFASDHEGWMNIAAEMGQEHYRTNDTGMTWKRCEGKSDVNNYSLSRPTHFVNSQLGWTISKAPAANDRRMIAHGVAQTVDGGCHWKQMWISKNSDESFCDMYFLNQSEGWLTGCVIGSLLHTRDGGRTWQALRLPTEGAKVTQVYFATPQQGWIITGREIMTEEDTGIYRTTDGGQTWSAFTKTELINGYRSGDDNPVPQRWKAGRLFQLLYVSNAKAHKG